MEIFFNGFLSCTVSRCGERRDACYCTCQSNSQNIFFKCLKIKKRKEDTCSSTKRKHAHARTQTKTGDNTHLEGNIIILVNRGASLQHIFRGSVFRLLVRQRRLPRRHRSCAAVISPQMCPRKACESRAQSRCPPACSPSARITRCVWPHKGGGREKRKGRRRKKKDHTLKNLQRGSRSGRGV